MTSGARYSSTGSRGISRFIRVRIRRAITIVAAMGLIAASIAFVALVTPQVAEAGPDSITGVSFGGTEASPTITVSGSGFGTQSDIGTPNAASDTQNCSPATGSDYGSNMYIYDETDPSYFVAGLGPPNLAAVGVIITTYTDSEIVFTLGSCYGQNGWVFAPGDSFTMYVLGAQYSASVSYPTETSETDWSAPQNVDGSGDFTSVSCASSQFCAAVDIYGNVLTYNGSSWSAPEMITEGGILSVSCPSTTFCVAVGEGGGENTWDGSSWNGPGPVGTDEYNLNSVSCTSSDFCVAVDDNGGADTWNGATWTGPTVVDSEGDLSSVSCTNSSFCVAVDEDGNAFVYDGTNWTSGTTSTRKTPLNRSPARVRTSAWPSIPKETPSPTTDRRGPLTTSTGSRSCPPCLVRPRRSALRATPMATSSPTTDRRGRRSLSTTM